MTNLLTSYLEKAQELNNPAYLQQKNEAKQAVISARIASVVGMTASAASGILGFCLVTSGGGAAIGSAILAISLPSGFFSYNASIATGNLMDVIENPRNYMKHFGVSGEYDGKSIKQKIARDTIGMETIIDIGVDILMLHSPQVRI